MWWASVGHPPLARARIFGKTSRPILAYLSIGCTTVLHCHYYYEVRHGELNHHNWTKKTIKIFQIIVFSLSNSFSRHLTILWVVIPTQNATLKHHQSVFSWRNIEFFYREVVDKMSIGSNPLSEIFTGGLSFYDISKARRRKLSGKYGNIARHSNITRYLKRPYFYEISKFLKTSRLEVRDHPDLNIHP